MVPCGAYQYCTHIAAQQFLYCSIILPQGTFSKNLQIDPILLFKVELT